MIRRRTAPLLTAVALLLASPRATAQAPAAQVPPSGAPFVERVDVNVVDVEVFVVDREGRRVTGLTREDFALFEDGRPVEISNFYAMSRGDRVAESLPAAAEPLPARPAAVPPQQQLHLVVYLDSFNILPAHRTRILGELRGFLEDRAFQGDDVMVVNFDRRVEVVQPFTRDPRELNAALDRLARRGGTRRLAQQAELRSAMLDIDMLADAGASDREGPEVGIGLTIEAAYSTVRGYVQRARQDLRVSAGGLESLVRALAGLPGRKALLYVSDGLPQRPGEVLYQHLADAFGTAAIRGTGGRVMDPYVENLQEDESALFNALVREANTHQITLYTLDASGTDGSALSPSAANAELSRHPGGQGTLAALEGVNLQEPLIAMAEGTGGRSILGTADFDGALARVAADFDGFYSLGYQVPEAGDGGYHQLEVRVDRPGLEVRHRAGYRDKPADERVADRTYATLYLDQESNPLGVRVEVGAAVEVGRDQVDLPVLVRVPVREVTLLPDGDDRAGELEIFFVVEDEHGLSGLRRIPYPVRIPSAMLARAIDQDVGYGVKLRVRAGLPTVAVGVWDKIGGEESYVQKRVITGP